MVKINADKTVYELVDAYPEIRGIMSDLGFRDITKPGMLQTAGRIMTLKKGTTVKGVAWETILQAFKDRGFELVERRQSDERVDK